MYAKFIPQWNHLFNFLLQGIIAILKYSRYFICSESIKKISIFAWYLYRFVFFFERSMQIPIKSPTGSIQDKEIENFTISYLHSSWLFILWFQCGFCYKKGTFGIFTRFCHLQMSETSGSNMAVELDSLHPLLPKTWWENEDLTLILRGKMEIFADTSAFNKNNTKTNKSIIVKNRKLAT